MNWHEYGRQRLWHNPGIYLGGKRYKVKLSLYLIIKHDATKTYGGVKVQIHRY
jgi:hypothetical protein